MTQPRPRAIRAAALLLTMAGVGVAGWLCWLPRLLPEHYRAAHWSVAWVGLDTVEAVALLAAGMAARTGRAATVPATVAATALALDGWFDVCTAATTTDRVLAVVLALLGEAPLALVAGWLAGAAAKATTVERPVGEQMDTRAYGLVRESRAPSAT